MYSYEKKIELMQQIMWDYHFSPHECLEVLEGKRKTVGHYNEYTLFRKLLESYRWYSIMEILPLERISKLLTKEVVNSLRMPSMRKCYEFVFERLQKTLSSSR